MGVRVGGSLLASYNLRFLAQLALACMHPSWGWGGGQAFPVQDSLSASTGQWYPSRRLPGCQSQLVVLSLPASAQQLGQTLAVNTPLPTRPDSHRGRGLLLPFQLCSFLGYPLSPRVFFIIPIPS